MTEMIEYLIPEWPAAAHVKAASTLRSGGCSEGAWAGLNLGAHVGDDPQRVAQNRQSLTQSLDLPRQPAWLEQVHGTAVCELSTWQAGCAADIATTDQPGQVCAVMTADCLPVLLTDRAGSRVAAVHAGWRGLAQGALESAVARFEDPSQLLAWLGPAIGPTAFEVGDEVRQVFISQHAAADQAFIASRPGHWRADLYRLARQRLHTSGVQAIYGGDRCTWSEPDQFYSFRRDQVTGRMASLIWLTE